jgi:hypothetical protein
LITSATVTTNPPVEVPPLRVLDENALVELFNNIRDELVSTLLYMLGNADDA